MLLPFIKFPFSNVQDGDVPLSHLKNNTGNPLEPEFYYSRNKNKLRKLYFFGIDLLMKLLSEQEEAKVSKAEWDTNQWENEKTEAPDEEEEEEPLGVRTAPETQGPDS